MTRPRFASCIRLFKIVDDPDKISILKNVRCVLQFQKGLTYINICQTFLLLSGAADVLENSPKLPLTKRQLGRFIIQVR
jgi:hypothetical protein